MRALMLVIVAVVAGCGGPSRAYPRWSFDERATGTAGCVDGEALVRVSGKAGVGVTLALRSHRTCAVQVTRAELVLDGQRVSAELPPAQTLPGRSLVYLWLPFPFDNDAAWNAGRRRGRFEFELVVDGAPATRWTVAAHHDFVDGRWAPVTRGGW
ncbi:MAG: hypothetical protein R3B06_23785 [Kofleriaceae bacterium]